MKLYVIRRPNGWSTPEALQAAAARSKQVGDEEMSEDIRWIRSYVVHEADGSLGTFCIYQASSPEKIREHAAACSASGVLQPLGRLMTYSFMGLPFSRSGQSARR